MLQKSQPPEIGIQLAGRGKMGPKACESFEVAFRQNADAEFCKSAVKK